MLKRTKFGCCDTMERASVDFPEPETPQVRRARRGEEGEVRRLETWGGISWVAIEGIQLKLVLCGLESQDEKGVFEGSGDSVSQDMDIKKRAAMSHENEAHHMIAAKYSTSKICFSHLFLVEYHPPRSSCEMKQLLRDEYPRQYPVIQNRPSKQKGTRWKGIEDIAMPYNERQVREKGKST